MTACDLCSNVGDLSELAVIPKDSVVALCGVCHPQVRGDVDLDENHWRCLNDSMWSETAAVQVLAWRMLNKLSATDWAGSLLEMLYLDDELREWAEYQEVVAAKHVDSLGAELSHGDGVVLIKDLDVKGGGFTAQTIVNLFKRIYQLAGIDGASSHSGRRQFVTQLADRGINARLVQVLARHKHLSTTQRYIDVNENALRNAVELLN